jgi:hypothetical protein
VTAERRRGGACGSTAPWGRRVMSDRVSDLCVHSLWDGIGALSSLTGVISHPDATTRSDGGRRGTEMQATLGCPQRFSVPRGRNPRRRPLKIREATVTFLRPWTIFQPRERSGDYEETRAGRPADQNGSSWVAARLVAVGLVRIATVARGFVDDGRRCSETAEAGRPTNTGRAERQGVCVLDLEG